MTKGKHGVMIAICAVIVAAGIGTYLLYRDNKPRYAKVIISLNASQQPFAWLITLDEGYLKNWAASAKAGDKTFVYNGKTYTTQGGKAST